MLWAGATTYNLIEVYFFEGCVNGTTYVKELEFV
jgi:hypothetical protein